jgi:hypothetical protein
MLAATATLMACAGQQNSPSSAAPQAPADPPYTEFRQLTASEKKIIASGVAKGLKDPESARFRWAPYPKSTEELVTYCGQVNAKNAMGGYVGFRSYIAGVMVNGGKVTGAVLIGTELSDSGNIVEEMCRKRGLTPLSAV